MNNLFALIAACFIVCGSSAQSFAPAPGQPGSTAIPKDSSCFVSWANGGTLYRGYIDINDTTATHNGSNRATFGELEYAFGPAEGNITNVVSLGDSGYVTLSFPLLITDGPGFDFAIFENGFMDHYMELGHVEVSSDGIHFFRFPSISEIPADNQLSNASTSNCGFVDNLAGKYRAGFGTPFDLADLPDDPMLVKSAIIAVRIVDAIGAISGTGTADQNGTIINDPYPTPYSSGGFDLDAVGIINGTLGTSDHLTETISIWPNPAKDMLQINVLERSTVHILSTDGKLLSMQEIDQKGLIDLRTAGISTGLYQVLIFTEKGIISKRLIVAP